jgi:hypothetical protein
MPLLPPENALTREAVLLYGEFGTGKSLAWATIAEMYRITETPGHFYIISTEWERALQIAEAYDGFFDNATVEEVEDFEGLLAVSQKIKAMGTKDDWVVIDSIGNAQTWARDEWFTANMGGRTYREWMADGGSAKDIGPAGWITMSNRYKSWINPNIVRFPGHKFACAQADRVVTEGTFADKGAVKALYERAGWKPAGEKELGYAFRSVLLTSKPTADTHELTTIKDSPGRGYLKHEAVAPLPLGFVGTYLQNQAGWRVT